MARLMFPPDGDSSPDARSTGARVIFGRGPALTAQNSVWFTFSLRFSSGTVEELARYLCNL